MLDEMIKNGNKGFFNLAFAIATITWMRNKTASLPPKGKHYMEMMTMERSLRSSLFGPTSPL